MKLSNVVRDFVFGMEDGLVSNLGLVLGVYVGGGDKYAIILAGLASMFAGAFSMSAGSYLAAKSQREVFEHEIDATKKNLEENPQRCYREMEMILKSEGFTKDEARGLLKKTQKRHHPEFVCDYLAQRKVGISKEKLDLPVWNAIMMFLSFLAGSTFPIAPFIFLSNGIAAVTASMLTLVALFGVGWAKSKFTHLNWVKSGMEIVIIGAGAGVIGYLVGLILSYL